MTGTHRLTAAEARRIPVRAQLLTADRPGDVLGAVQHLTMLQLDQTRRIAPSHDVVLFTRLGSSYDPEARSLGIARPSGPELPGEAAIVGDAGEPAEVEGTSGAWRVDPVYWTARRSADASRSSRPWTA